MQFLVAKMHDQNVDEIDTLIQNVCFENWDSEMKGALKNWTTITTKNYGNFEKTATVTLKITSKTGTLKPAKTYFWFLN